ncbi:hypothetical protein AGMMS49992_27530 [Clostridia bacterium]|nr:hypothetical protein AGMMS49992_27530 [Clostridia bacterium]
MSDIDIIDRLCYHPNMLLNIPRRVRLAAIQPNCPPPDAQFDCLSPGFNADVDAVIDGHVIPLLDTTIDLLLKCADAGADLAVTCEDVTGLCGFLPSDGAFFDELTERSAAIATQRFAAAAKQRRMRIAACFGIRERGRNFNATLFFNTDGHVEGIYRKTHLPPNERWQFTPGQTLDVFELDIGRVAAAICYDMMFPECIATLARKGAEIIVHPTGGMGWYDDIGLATLRVRANDASAYLVTSKNFIHNGAGHSSIVDPWGHVRADAAFEENAIVTFDAELPIRKTQPEWFWQTRMTGVADLRQRMATERRPDLYTPLTDTVEALRIPNAAQREKIRGEIRRGECHW